MVGLGSVLPISPTILIKISALFPQALLGRNPKRPQAEGDLGSFSLRTPPLIPTSLGEPHRWSSAGLVSWYPTN